MLNSLDKNQFQNKLKNIKAQINQEILEIFSANNDKEFQSKLKSSLKEDKSIVTYMDQLISDIFKKDFMPIIPHFNFYSEEEQCSLKFPALIIDPIDGTKEFSKAIPECCVSVGIFNSPDLEDPQNYAWIYNPLTGFELSSDDVIKSPVNLDYHKNILSGLVSSTEWSESVLDTLSKQKEVEKLQLLPLGSIAFKLALLASGGADYVISQKPKNIWDIAAGTLLCFQRGIYFYNKGKKLTSLSKEMYYPDLLWCRENIKNYFNTQNY
ncbi:MAG: inositol monophosphatase family protein [Candidatus Caenarcaniphilales bacterium]|nr:inositol monophosphatase family protein [Candidatus Caenarcaniphilales bacterium]